MEDPLGQPWVLVADDQALVRDVLRIALEDAGYRVVALSTGLEAIEALFAAEYAFSALVTDINFGAPPRGWDVAARAREAFAGIAVVYITGESAHEWTSHGVPLSEIIKKPFAPSQVTAALSTLLGAIDRPQAEG